MEFKGMPAAAHRGRAGGRGRGNVIPQAQFAGSVDKEVSDRPVCCGPIAEEIDLARITDEVEVNACIPFRVGGWKCFLGVGIAIGGIGLGCICATMN